jgi:hypothetical protein
MLKNDHVFSIKVMSFISLTTIVYNIIDSLQMLAIETSRSISPKINKSFPYVMSFSYKLTDVSM